MSYNVPVQSAASVPTPTNGLTLFVDSADGAYKSKDTSGTVAVVGGGGSSTEPVETDGTTPRTLDADDLNKIHVYTAAGAAVWAMTPSADCENGDRVTVRNASANSLLTLAPDSGDSINGAAAAITIGPGGCATVVYDTTGAFYTLDDSYRTKRITIAVALGDVTALSGSSNYLTTSLVLPAGGQLLHAEMELPNSGSAPAPNSGNLSAFLTWGSSISGFSQWVNIDGWSNGERVEGSASNPSDNPAVGARTLQIYFNGSSALSQMGGMSEGINFNIIYSEA